MTALEQIILNYRSLMSEQDKIISDLSELFLKYKRNHEALYAINQQLSPLINGIKESQTIDDSEQTEYSDILLLDGDELPVGYTNSENEEKIYVFDTSGVDFLNKDEHITDKDESSNTEEQTLQASDMNNGLETVNHFPKSELQLETYDPLSKDNVIEVSPNLYDYLNVFDPNLSNRLYQHKVYLCLSKNRESVEIEFIEDKTNMVMARGCTDNLDKDKFIYWLSYVMQSYCNVRLRITDMSLEEAANINQLVNDVTDNKKGLVYKGSPVMLYYAQITAADKTNKHHLRDKAN